MKFVMKIDGLASIPILYIYLIKKNIVKNSELSRFINICVITSFLSIILNACYGGICESYSIDFKLILSIGAIIILLKWIESSEKIEINDKIFIILCIMTIFIMLPLNLTTEANFLTNLTSDTTVYLKNIFEFWN